MTKQLIIRLSGQADGNIPWVLWQPGGRSDTGALDSDSSTAAGVLDHGVLDHAQQLSELAAHSLNAKVTVLVSSTEIAFHQLDLPPGSKRHLAQVVPYALEEELAQDISELHFAWQASAWQTGGRRISGKQDEASTDHGLPVVVVAKKQLQSWIDWLADAGIRYQALIPDLFILPLSQDEWSAMSLDDDIVVRHSNWRGFAIEHNLFAELSGLFSDAMTPPSRIRCWGPLEWPQAPAQLAQADDYQTPNSALLLARDLPANPGINLLQGEFAQQRKRRKSIGVWRWPAVAAGILVALLFVDKGLYIWQLNQQIAQTSSQIEQRYRDTFPNETRVVNVRSQLNQHLARLQGGGESSEVLALLSALSEAFSSAPLDITLLQFDAGRNELRIQATGADFATFERFSELASQQDLDVEQGQLNSRQGRIAGTLTVRGAQ